MEPVPFRIPPHPALSHGPLHLRSNGQPRRGKGLGSDVMDLGRVVLAGFPIHELVERVQVGLG